MPCKLRTNQDVVAHILDYSDAEDVRSIADALSTTKASMESLVDHRLNPCRLFSPITSDPERLMAGLMTYGAVLTGSRGGEYFVRGCSKPNSGFDFLVNTSPRTMLNTGKNECLPEGFSIQRGERTEALDSFVEVLIQCGMKLISRKYLEDNSEPWSDLEYPVLDVVTLYSQRNGKQLAVQVFGSYELPEMLALRSPHSPSQCYVGGYTALHACSRLTSENRIITWECGGQALGGFHRDGDLARPGACSYCYIILKHGYSLRSEFLNEVGLGAHLDDKLKWMREFGYNATCTFRTDRVLETITENAPCKLGSRRYDVYNEYKRRGFRPISWRDYLRWYSRQGCNLSNSGETARTSHDSISAAFRHRGEWFQDALRLATTMEKMDVLAGKGGAGTACDCFPGERRIDATLVNGIRSYTFLQCAIWREYNYSIEVGVRDASKASRQWVIENWL